MAWISEPKYERDRFSPFREKRFHGQDFILLYLTVYMFSTHLKFLNNMAIYSLCDVMYTATYVK
jgi:hypothetical protein